METIVNKVANSEIETFDLENLWDGLPIKSLDLAPFLYKGMIVREKDFRVAVKEYDWSEYAEHHVAVFCSVDTIVPIWAFMLVASRLDGLAASVTQGNRDQLVRSLFDRKLESLDLEPYRDRIVVVKGCGSDIVPLSAYVDITIRLQGVAKKVMYGEACSSVPLWRRPAG